MNRRRDGQVNALITEQAAEWFIHLVADDLSPNECREYAAWLKESPRHVAAMIDVYRVHGLLRHAKLPQPELGNLPSNVIPLMMHDSMAAAAPFAQTKEAAQIEQRSQRMGRGKIAAAVAGVAFAATLAFMFNSIYVGHTISTGPGEWAHTTLVDGSVVHVGPNTTLRLAFGEDSRTITVVRGEALFEVAKDPSRPFIVRTGLGAVRAVGTEFGVSVAEGEVVITVADGKVAVTDSKASAASKQSEPARSVVPLSANEQITLSRQGSESVKKVDAQRELQWATGAIEVEGETISDVAEQFNRRNSLRIVIDDPEVGRITMPYFKLQLDEPATFADFVDARPDVRAVRKRDAIHLERE